MLPFCTTESFCFGSCYRKVSKPFLLPQNDPRMYNSSLLSYNVPEFVTSKVNIDAKEIEKLALLKERKQMTYRKE